MSASRVCVSRTSRAGGRCGLGDRGRLEVRGCVRGAAPLPTSHTAPEREQDRHEGGLGTRRTLTGHASAKSSSGVHDGVALEVTRCGYRQWALRSILRSCPSACSAVLNGPQAYSSHTTNHRVVPISGPPERRPEGHQRGFGAVRPVHLVEGDPGPVDSVGREAHGLDGSEPGEGSFGERSVCHCWPRFLRRAGLGWFGEDACPAGARAAAWLAPSAFRLPGVTPSGYDYLTTLRTGCQPHIAHWSTKEQIRG